MAHNAFPMESMLLPVSNLPVNMIVTTPIANLYLQPGVIQHDPKYPSLSKNNPLLYSQLLYGECLFVFEQKKDHQVWWFKVYALEQKECYASTGAAYKTGWINEQDVQQVKTFPISNIIVHSLVAPILKAPFESAECLFNVCIGTKLLGKKIQSEWIKLILPNGRDAYIQQKHIYFNHSNVKESLMEMRQNICETASMFMNNEFGINHYSWGGRCPYCPLFKNQQTGTDNTGFINLIYRANGLEIPRDAQGQYELCEEIVNGKNVKPGDLIFFANKDNQEKINHVALYTYKKSLGNYLIECVEDNPSKIRTILDVERFGKDIKKIHNGDLCKGKYIYFGSYLNKPSLINFLRNESLRTYFPEFRGLSLTETTTKTMA